ncbi:MAG: histidine kinase [Magnetococcales bacterium]|nr:histidine kinase [Magnetococcales bacterium]
MGLSWQWLVPLVSIAYLGLLFAVAYFADSRASQGRSLISNPYVYTLSIAVYCTSWTFYGSVGRASVSGIGFLPIYLGPTIIAAIWWPVLGKIIKISKVNRITSIADFIASRYGKSRGIAAMVTMIAVVGIMPYISLQLKAIATSLDVLVHHLQFGFATISYQAPWGDTALYVALILALFSIFFGTRHLDATERHEGMVAAIAFESIIKLLAFLAVGIFVTFGLFDGPAHLFQQAVADPKLKDLMGFDALPGGYANWFSLTFLAMMAVLFLPRQFQVLVVENVNENHIHKAAWLFPLYLLIINLFVLPIAFAGDMIFHGAGVDPDTFVLTLPIYGNQQWLALFAYIGGLSAATGMVIVAVIALSTMVCNDLVIPALLRLQLLVSDDLSGTILAIRRGVILTLLLLGYMYFRFIGESYALVTIGLVSFAAAAQFAPPILIGIFWKGASRRGAIVGLIAGFLVWAHTLLFASFALSGWVPETVLTVGPWGISWLRPQALFGLDVFDPITHSVFWSMLFNIGLLVGVSLFDRQTSVERIQALNFVDVFEQGAIGGDAYLWSGSVSVFDLKKLLARFVGPAVAELQVAQFIDRNRLKLSNSLQAPSTLVAFAEQRLAGAIGSASARIMIHSVVKGEEMDLERVMRILDQTSQVIEYSQRLEEKSAELEAATQELKQANIRLQELDSMKDDFISTISHELRTPLTSIRAFSEILHDNSELSIVERQKFLSIVIKETERLTRLVNQVLDLAKLESGRMDWRPTEVDLALITREAIETTSQLFEKQSVKLENLVPDSPTFIYADRDRIQRVVINLLSNAVKFSHERGGLVTIRLHKDDWGVGLEVEDNGPGITKGDEIRIFDKFHQVQDESGENSQGGSGLGLAICQRIIEHHHGRIWVESRPGQGATFIFTLPEDKAAENKLSAQPLDSPRQTN